MPATLVELFRELPSLRPNDDPDLWAARMHDGLRVFRQKLLARYTEGTLQRLLTHPEEEARRASALALGLVGTMDSNSPLARALHDGDAIVAQTATDSLWQVWFRGGTDEENAELQQIMQLSDFPEILAGLDELILRAPEFSEAYTQRAILYFRRGEYLRAAADCERVIQLNPFHFGAQTGLAQCYLKMRRPRTAIRAFRLALQMNPTLTHLRETIQSLEGSIGG